MAWLPAGEKISKISIRFGTIHERDKRTDGRTHDIGRAYASHRAAETRHCSLGYDISSFCDSRLKRTDASALIEFAGVAAYRFFAYVTHDVILLINKMLSKEDRVLKGYGAKRIMTEFPGRNFSLASVKCG